MKEELVGMETVNAIAVHMRYINNMTGDVIRHT